MTEVLALQELPLDGDLPQENDCLCDPCDCGDCSGISVICSV